MQQSTPTSATAEFVLLMAAMVSIMALSTDIMLPALGTIASDLGVQDRNNVQLEKLNAARSELEELQAIVRHGHNDDSKDGVSNEDRSTLKIDATAASDSGNVLAIAEVDDKTEYEDSQVQHKDGLLVMG